MCPSALRSPPVALFHFGLGWKRARAIQYLTRAVQFMYHDMQIMYEYSQFIHFTDCNAVQRTAQVWHIITSWLKCLNPTNQSGWKGISNRTNWAGLLFRMVAEFVFFGTDLTPEIAICSKRLQNVPRQTLKMSNTPNRWYDFGVRIWEIRAEYQYVQQIAPRVGMLLNDWENKCNIQLAYK